MNLSGIKLVVSDMDGTLLNPDGQISKRFLKQFRELKKRNIHFVAASGRQYQSILEKLDHIKEDISIIAENGGLVRHNKDEQILFKFSETDVRKAIEIIRSVPESYIVLCGRKSAYIESNDTLFVNTLKKYYSEIQSVGDLTKVTNDDFLKIAVYHFRSSEECVLPFLDDVKNFSKIVVSGENWLDISHPKVDKSFALDLVQKDLKISKEETMVFGDYNNDLKMMDLADYSFAMENAHQNVKEAARYSTKSNLEEGVEEILAMLLSES